MNGLTSLERVRLNAIIFEYAEQGMARGLKSLFNQVYLCTGSAEIALDAIRRCGEKRKDPVSKFQIVWKAQKPL